MKQATHPSIHKDEVHLHEGEDQLEDWVDTSQDLVAWWCHWDLKEHTKLQSIVDHGPQSKCCQGKAEVSYFLQFFIHNTN